MKSSHCMVTDAIPSERFAIACRTSQEVRVPPQTGSKSWTYLQFW